MTECRSWFPYTLRPHQDKAISLATDTFAKRTVGLLSADCGVGKTIAVLSGYLASRGDDPDYRLFVLTRTHSQSKVFEEELAVLCDTSVGHDIPLTATSMVSRVHMCPNSHRISSDSSTGFIRGCAAMIRTGNCSYYWNFYTREGEESRAVPRNTSLESVDGLLRSGVVTREIVEQVRDYENLCPYEVMRWCARRSRVIIGPYAYLFRERVRNSLLASLGTPLPDLDILVDEAHNLPEHVLDSEAAIIKGEDLRWLRDNISIIRKETGIDWIGDAVDFLWETLMVNLDKMSRTCTEVQLHRWDVVPRFVSEDSLRTLLASSMTVEDLDTVPTETPLDRLVDFLYIGQRTKESDDWHVTAEIRRRWDDSDVSIDDSELRIRPLNAAGLIAPILRGSRASLLMSGTLRPLDLYAGLMGVKGALNEDLASPYPKGSRMLLLDKDISTKYTERGPDLWKELATKIGTALTSLPAEKSALIAFPSYSIMTEVLSYNIDCGFRKRLVEDRSIRIEMLKEQVKCEPTAVFLVYGGKFSEGVDLVQNHRSLVELVIGVGIPFSPPTSYQNALQQWYEKRFGAGAGYYYSSVVPSIRKVVQLVGRLRRSPDDWGVVLLLDRRFKKHIGMFGSDAASDLWVYADSSEMKGAIGLFLEARGEDIVE